MRPKKNKENKKLPSAEPVQITDTAIECLLVSDNETKRQSLGKRRSLLLPKERDEYIGDENDDETEKRARREAAEEEARKQKEEVQQKETKKTPFSATNNFSKDQWEEHFSRCIQLCNQNKVNCKNAFKLKIIDYMKLIFLNKSKKIENLSLMSCTLDASAKIYSYRVDKVYADMVKVISGKEWTKEDDNDNENEKEKQQEEDVEEEEDQANKKKKKSRNSDFSELQLDKMLCKDDQQLEKSENQEGESSFKVKTFPTNDIEYFLECPISDPEGELLLNGPVFTTSLDPGSNRSLQLGPRYTGQRVSVDPNLYLADYKNMYNSFALIGEGNQSEIREVDKDLMYDADELVLQDELRCQPDNDDMVAAINEPEYCGDYDDCCMEDDETVHHMNSVQLKNITPVPKVAPFSVQAMTKLVSAEHDEFSFFDNSKVNFWSGPSHWSIKQSTKKIGQKLQKDVKKPARKVQGVDLSMENVEDIIKAYSESINVTLATKTLKMWNKSKCSEPEDIHYTQKQMLSLFCNNHLLYIDKNFKSLGVHFSSGNDQDCEEAIINSFKINEEGEEEIGDGDHFDDLINDSPLSPGSDLAQPLLEPGSIAENTNDVSNNKADNDLIPAPFRVNEIQIDYAKTQKKINMKVLKATIWKLLNLDSDVEIVPGPNRTSKKVVFSNVYLNLFNELPKEDAKALSFPIAYMALLHLANEKALFLEGDNMYHDVTVMLASPPKMNLIQY